MSGPPERRVKLLAIGRSQGELELPGDRAIMRREGERLIVEPVRRRSLLAVLARLEPLDADFGEVSEAPVDEVEL